MTWWDRAWKDQAEDWVYGWLNPAQAPAGCPCGNVEPDAAYLNVFLKSARIVNVRKGLNKFYGVVHSFMKLPHRSKQSAEFNVVTTPAALKDIDADGIDRVVQVNKRLLGPAPYVDGDLEIEIGLFSVPSSDLAAPYLSLLESLSSQAGVAFISSALPFAAPILQGVKLLTGGGNVTLEIGLSITEPKPKQGYCVVMRAPKQAVALSSLTLDPSDFRLLDSGGRPVADYPYMVIEVSAQPRRPDWFEIPDLQRAYARIQELYREGRDDETNAALQMFRRIALTCNDLLAEDARLLADKAQSLYRTVIQPESERRGVSKTGSAREFPDLRELNPFYSSGPTRGH